MIQVTLTHRNKKKKVIKVKIKIIQAILYEYDIEESTTQKSAKIKESIQS